MYSLARWPKNLSPKERITQESKKLKSEYYTVKPMFKGIMYLIRKRIKAILIKPAQSLNEV